MAGGEELVPSPASPDKHCRSPDDVQPEASPKRRKRHHRRSHRHRHADSPPPAVANPIEEDEVEEGEILDDAVAASAAAMDVDENPPAAPGPCGNGADTDSIADATKLHASALPTQSPSKDEWKSDHCSHESKRRGIPSSKAEDSNLYGQSQISSKSPQSRSEKGRRHRDDHHTSSSKDSLSEDHYSRRHIESHARGHSRSREKGAEANGSRASMRDDSDHDGHYWNTKSSRHSTRTQDNERERSSSRGVRDDRHDSKERYRDDRKHRDRVLDRDQIDSHELTRRHRERSSSRSRPERRENSHLRDESRERERLSGISRHNDQERRDVKDRRRGSDMVDNSHERVKGSENHRTGERRDKSRNSDRHGDSTRVKHSVSDVYKERPRSREKARDVDHKSRRSEEMKKDSFKEEDEEEYQEKIEQQLAMQEEDDPEKIKEEARRRKEAIMAKYRQQQLQEQHVEPLPSSNNEEIRLTDKDEMTHRNDDNDSNSMDNDETDNKHDSPEVFVGESDFTVGKSPARNDIFTSLGALDNEGVICVSGLGEGTPKSERSADMFCDDIFGESPAGTRKAGKNDGLHINRNALHDNWDDAEGYYTYRFGELLDGRFEITAAHGKGVFSTVVRAKDLKAGKGDPEEVAIKIIRNNETMYKTGKQEVSILEKLASADREDRRHCVRFISSFIFSSP